ncbi:MAG: hypothetical protein EXR55_04415 [Dehalococcoidia bacterium]|nr:hypothetical protein [Dehalococcoidia bacterium]
MIVRIVGEGQFQVSSALLDELNERDNQIVRAVAQGRERAYYQAFTRLLNLVRRRGRPLAADDLRPSDVALPAADTTFEEARQLFVGEGLVRG